MAVEEVTRAKARSRFIELPRALHGHDPRWTPLVLAWERYRLDRHRNPYFERGDAALFLARRAGRPVGRIAAHLAAPGTEGRFGFWSVADDHEVAAVLVDAAQGWLSEQGCRSMEGPVSFTAAEEVGVLAEGFEAPGLTGRSWSPPWESASLEALGFERAAALPRWRLATAGGPGPVATQPQATVDDPPGQAARHGDPRLVLSGIAAVPDLSAALRSVTLRGAWGLARRVREGRWDVCTVVRCTDPPAVAVPALRAAAAAAGYREVVAPWSPDPGAPPETVHRTYRLSW